MRGCRISLCRRSTVAPAQGTTVRATTREAIRLKVMVQAMSARSVRTMPLAKTMGRKTQTVVRVEERMGAATCRAPWTAARGAGTPRFRSR